MAKKLDPSYRPEFAVLNGEVVSFGEAKISIMAPGLTFAATVFEGMRALLVEGVFDADLLINAALLNCVFVGLGIASFLAIVHIARVKGLILQMGE